MGAGGFRLPWPLAWVPPESVVSGRLAAGAQITGPVTGVFWHLGELGEGEEWQLLLKTTTARYPELEEHLIEHHPWDNPEVCAVAIAHGSEEYLRWITDCVAPTKSS